MPGYLRQSTAVDIPLGPFLDDTDGKTAETALTISQADVRLKKNAAAWAQKNQSSSATHEENGNYEVSLDTTDTNTLGILRVHVAESGALPVWDTFTVIPADLYDTMFTANANRGIVIVAGTIGSTGNSTTALHLTGLTYGDDEINDLLLVIKDVSTGERHSRWIDDWADTGDLATVATLPFTPENAVDTYEILAIRKDGNVATILADTNDIQTRIPAALVSGRIDASVGAMAANVMTAAAAASDLTTELQNGLATAAALATVDGIVDSILALLDDARTEPGQGAPPVNPDMATKIDYLYKAWRNKKEQTATLLTIYADNGTTADHKSTVSDDGTTFTAGEMATGA